MIKSLLSMKKCLYLLVLLLALPSPAHALTAKEEAVTAVNVITAYTKQFNHIIALIEKEPFNHEHYVALAYWYDTGGMIEKAKESLLLAVDHMEERAEHYADIAGTLSYYYLDLGEVEEALPWAKEAVAYGADDPSTWHFLAQHSFQMNRNDQAAYYLNQLNQSEQTRTDDVYYLFYRNYIEREDSDMPSRLTDLFKRAVQQEPDNAKALRAQAMAYRMVPDSDNTQVKALILRAMAANPDYGPTYMTMASTYYYWAFFDKEMQEYAFEQVVYWANKALGMDYPLSTSAHHFLGVSLLYLGLTDQAIDHLEKHRSLYTEVDQENDWFLAGAYNQKAYAHYQSGENLEEGMDWINKALALRPDDGIYISTKGELYYAMGEYDKAYTYMKRAIELAPEHEEIQRDWAMIQTKMAELKD